MNWSNFPASRACFKVVIMRFYHMESAVSQPAETTKEWLSGLVVIVATVVAFVGFAFASLKWTLIVSSVVLAFLVVFLWSVGFRKQRSRRQSDAGR